MKYLILLLILIGCSESEFVAVCVEYENYTYMQPIKIGKILSYVPRESTRCKTWKYVPNPKFKGVKDANK